MQTITVKIQNKIVQLLELPVIQSNFLRQKAEFGGEAAIEWLTKTAIACIAFSEGRGKR